MSDVGALLRTISKSEDYDIPDVKDYLTRYKDFSDGVASLVHLCRSDDLRESDVRDITAASDRLKECVPAIYDDVVALAALLREDGGLEAFKVKKAEESSAGGKKKERESTEEKNAFALTVLRRVRLKLEGREPDALRRSTVAEQVRKLKINLSLFLMFRFVCYSNTNLLSHVRWTLSSARPPAWTISRSCTRVGPPGSEGENNAERSPLAALWTTTTTIATPRRGSSSSTMLIR